MTRPSVSVSAKTFELLRTEAIRRGVTLRELVDEMLVRALRREAVEQRYSGGRS